MRHRQVSALFVQVVVLINWLTPDSTDFAPIGFLSFLTKSLNRNFISLCLRNLGISNAAYEIEVFRKKMEKSHLVEREMLENNIKNFKRTKIAPFQRPI